MAGLQLSAAALPGRLLQGHGSLRQERAMAKLLVTPPTPSHAKAGPIDQIAIYGLLVKEGL